MGDRRATAPRARHDETGLSILEVVLAMTLFALAIVGIFSSAGTGLRLTRTSNARQTATQVANQEMEELRAAAFASIALVNGTTYETSVPGSPDQGVDTSTSPPRYTVPLTSPVTEPLLAGGGVVHKPAAQVVGTRTFQAYRYVTVPAAPTGSRRVTIVVRYRDNDASGRPNQVVLSSLFSPGRIDYRASSSTTSSSTPSTTTSPTTTTPPSTTTTALCPGDTSPPSGTAFSIADGSGADAGSYVHSTGVLLKVDAVDPCTPVTAEFSNDNGVTWSGATTIPPGPGDVSAGWSLTAGEGLRTVLARFKDARGNTTGTSSDTVTVDLFNPSAPPMGDTTASNPSGSAANFVTVKWSADSVDNPEGSGVVAYDIFKRVGTGSYTKLATVNVVTTGNGCKARQVCDYVDSGLTEGSTYSYYVVGVDRSGRASSPSNPARACLVPTADKTTVTCTQVAP